jgi:hypothetical protein
VPPGTHHAEVSFKGTRPNSECQIRSLVQRGRPPKEEDIEGCRRLEECEFAARQRSKVAGGCCCCVFFFFWFLVFFFNFWGVLSFFFFSSVLASLPLGSSVTLNMGGERVPGTAKELLLG